MVKIICLAVTGMLIYITVLMIIAANYNRRGKDKWNGRKLEDLQRKVKRNRNG